MNRRPVTHCGLIEAVEPRTHFAVGFNPTNSDVGPHTVAVAVDFNGDRVVDVVARGADGRLNFFAGLGDGRFTLTNAATPIDAGPSVVAIAAGDFNRDGVLDLAAANSAAAANTGSVAIMLGSGNGIFSAATHYTAGPNPSGLAVGDFNRDGRLDLAVSNNALWPATTPTAPTGFAAAILYATNSGFAAPTRLSLGFPQTAVVSMSQPVLATSVITPTTLAFAGPNLLLATPIPHTVVAIVPLGNTIAAPVTQFGMVGANRGLAPVDLTRDGKLDLAVLQAGLNTTTGGANVYTISSRPISTTASNPYALNGPFATGLSSAVGIVGGYFDYDRVGDVAVAGGMRRLTSEVPTVIALAGASNGALSLAGAGLLPTAPAFIAAAQVNSDGLMDLVVTTSNGITAMLNRPPFSPTLVSELHEETLESLAGANDVASLVA